MDPLDRIEQIISLLEGARSVPMSNMCMINRSEVLEVLATLRSELPTQLREAQNILHEREQILEVGRREAEQIHAAAEAEAQRQVATSEIVLAAEQAAHRVQSDAATESERLRQEADTFVDTSLANLEQLLSRTLEDVRRGRNRMSAVSDLSGGLPHDAATNDKPLPFY